MNILKTISVTVSVSSVLMFSSPLLALAAGPSAVTLGSSSAFTILSKTGISTTGTTAVVGDIGVSPAPATYITGFALTLPAASAFSTSAIVTGKVYASDYANPTPALLTTAILDMQNAYTDGMGRAAGVTELGAGNIGGLTLAPNVYKWGTGVVIPTDVTLSGSANDVWIFQIAQTLTVSSGVKITLSGGAQASNVFWVVGGQTTLGTGASFKGIILDQTAIVINNGAQLQGRALAQTAVTLDSNAVSAPSVTTTAPVIIPTPTPTPTPTTAPVTTVTTTAPASNVTNSIGVSVPPTTTAVTTSANGNISNVSTVTTPLSSIRSVTTSLHQKNSGSDVMILQNFLITQNNGSAALALGRVGATGYFGALTRAALAEFQAHAGISPALGNFGAITRSYLSLHY